MNIFSLAPLWEFVLYTENKVLINFRKWKGPPFESLDLSLLWNSSVRRSDVEVPIFQIVSSFGLTMNNLIILVCNVCSNK